MMKRKKLIAFTLALVMALSPMQSFAAEKITTKKSTISKNTDVDEYVVDINGDTGVRSFHVYAQGGTRTSKKSFVAQHGCAVSALTCILSGYTTKYANYTPEKVVKKLEKKVFGEKAWSANYSKSLSAQRPVSLYGITKILNYCGISSKYVRYFKDKKAINQITSHLESGNAVIIEVNNHKQKNGNFSSAYNYRWSSSKHTMALLGITNTGKVIVADSANRSWSGSRQRIKYTTMEHLVQFMIPCKRSSKSLYYTSVDSCGGYILVNYQK
ncbi:MAG: hypothetical protein LUF92_16975 [Clostridiales bacterium]|nr:hypothetical protein [Clostridiales bacterium]